MNSNRNFPGKVYDPVFVCMVLAIVLAIGTSVLLRAMAAGGPRAARAGEIPRGAAITPPR
jgi:hypothetical protein